MKKLLLLGALLVLGTTSMANVTVDLGNGTGGKVTGTGYLPIVSKGEVINVTNKYSLRITPTSNIGPDGSSILFDFGQLVKGDKKSLIGQFTAQVIGNDDGTETPVAIAPTTLTTAFDKGDGTGAGTDTSITSKIMIAKDGANQGGGQVAAHVGHIDYSLTGAFEGTTKYIGNVQADARIDGADATVDANVGTFIDRTQRVAVTITDLDVTEIN